MKSLLRSGLLLAFLLGAPASVTGCGNETPKTDKDDGDKKKAKKDRDEKKDDKKSDEGEGDDKKAQKGDDEKTKEAKADEAPKESDSPLAKQFTGEPDEGVKFLRMAAVPDEPITFQVFHNWRGMEPGGDKPLNGDAAVWDKHSHAKIWMMVVPKKDAFTDKELSFNTQRISARKASYGEPVAGRIGAPPGLPAKISEGTCTMYGKEGHQCFYAIAEVSPSQSLIVFASLRKDVYPKLEKELFNILRSIKVNR